MNRQKNGFTKLSMELTKTIAQLLMELSDGL